MQNVFGFDKEYNTSQFIEKLQGFANAGILQGIHYSYDLIGFLHSFKLTKKGFSCFDSLGNYVYIQSKSKIKWYSLCIMYDKKEN